MQSMDHIFSSKSEVFFKELINKNSFGWLVFKNDRVISMLYAQCRTIFSTIIEILWDFLGSRTLLNNFECMIIVLSFHV